MNDMAVNTRMIDRVAVKVVLIICLSGINKRLIVKKKLVIAQNTGLHIDRVYIF
jgi:hypothetical protein